MRERFKRLAKGSRFPPENDSAFLLDVHERGIPGAARMARYADDFEVDMVVVGAGAGGSTLAQRLARRGWKIVILESGPFWDPDEDWVSDEAGQHGIYWTAKRIIGGEDPVELGKNNSGHGVGGSMIHYAGYTPRFHPSDFETHTRDGVGADWPISYWDLKPHYERVELELPVAGQDWPWGDPHRYPHAPHPVSGAAEQARRGLQAAGIGVRVGPVGIPNGTFGNRPHCIYRGFCLQPCKVNAKSSPYVTHLPDAIEHGVEVRANSHAVRVEIDEAGRCTGVTYDAGGEQHFREEAPDFVHGTVVGESDLASEALAGLRHEDTVREPGGRRAERYAGGPSCPPGVVVRTVTAARTARRPNGLGPDRAPGIRRARPAAHPSAASRGPC
jgi:hypothetical protein